MTKSHRWGTAWRRGVACGAVALAAAVLLTAGPDGRGQARKGGESLPADLDLVPRDAVGFVSARVADLLANEHVKKMRREYAKLSPEPFRAFDGGQALGVRPDDVERLTVVMPKMPQPNDPPPPVVVLVVRTTKPYDKGKVLSALLPGGKEQTFKGKTLHAGDGAGLYFADERTYVMGPSAAIEGVLDAGKGDGPLGVPLVRAAGTSPVTLGGNGAPFRQLLAQVPASPKIDPFRPLFEMTSVTAVLDFGKGTRLEGRMLYPTAGEAQEGARAAKALVELITALGLPEAEKELARASVKADKFGALLKDLSETLKTPPVETKGSAVHIDVALKADLGALASAIDELVLQARGAAARMTSQNNLKQIALALHNYHDAQGKFPAAAVTDKNGKALLSWRVAILPYVEQDALYREFRLDEPWDSAHNKKLIARVPPVYQMPGKEKTTKTHYRVFVGNGSAFEADEGTALAGITDGTSNTLMVVEAADAVEWTKPDDLPYDPKKDLPKLGVDGKGFHTAFADGSVRYIKKEIDPVVLRALITRNGGEVISRETIP